MNWALETRFATSWRCKGKRCVRQRRHCCGFRDRKGSDNRPTQSAK